VRIRGASSCRGRSGRSLPLPLVQSVRGTISPVAAAARIDRQFRGETVTKVTQQNFVETVLRNFITDALRNTPRGQRIDIRCKIFRHRAVLTVVDTGLGISAEQQQRIFDSLIEPLKRVIADTVSGTVSSPLQRVRSQTHSRCRGPRTRTVTGTVRRPDVKGRCGCKNDPWGPLRSNAVPLPSNDIVNRRGTDVHRSPH